MLKITKSGKKVAVLKDDASEPEMIELEEQKRISIKHLAKPEEDKEKANDDMERMGKDSA